MATKQFLMDRIQKATENITKKQNTISKKTKLISKKEDQIRKLGFNPEEASCFGWCHDEKQNKAGSLAVDIDWLQDDISRLQKEITDLQKKLEGYQAELQTVTEKENSRNIKVILDFLEMWKEQMKDFYSNHTEDWITTLQKYWEEDRKYCQWYNTHFAERKNKDLMKEMERPVEEAKAVHAMYGFLDPYMVRSQDGYILDMEKLQKDLDAEANAKYDFIIERTNAIVGEITDASNLTIGQKGDLNGYIIGTKGVAKVQTIGAGGYNIQCYHFRTLIHAM